MTLTVVAQDFATLLSLNRYVVLMLVLSVLLLIAIGDTAYFKAQNYVGVSRAFPITNLTPLLTLFLAHALLGEPLTETILVGVLFIMGGIYFITQSPKNELSAHSEDGHRQVGFGLALLAAISWSFGILALKVALGEISSISANSVRYVFAILFLFLMGSWNGSIRKIRTYSRQTIKVVAIATVFNIMLGSLLSVDSIKFAGASKATILFSTSPLFALPIAVIFLGEAVSWKILFGTLMTVIGVWLVI